MTTKAITRLGRQPSPQRLWQQRRPPVGKRVAPVPGRYAVCHAGV